ncbi:MAG: hypothetical protein Q7R93_02140 [bacterium]|nr:hypothetical protein [bacterium]
MSTLEFKTNDRGLRTAEFRDSAGSDCSLGESSSVREKAVWLGVSLSANGSASMRMHLTQEEVEALLPHLQRFVATGKL